MRKNLRSQKKLIYSDFNVKICLILIVITGSFQFSSAQTLHYPLSKYDRNYKPGKTQTSLVKNNPAFLAPETAGTWTALTNSPAYAFGGAMLLLSDGTVLAKSYGGTGVGTIYTKLTPDSSGSYINGTWSAISPMQYDRLYYSSQVLKDGRVYVAGGEYGDGGLHGEVYDSYANRWTLTPDPGTGISDANSEILEDGRVLQALVLGTGLQTVIYDPSTNTYSNGPNTLGRADESAWVKLPDGSILFVDIPYPTDNHTTERYIPATNSWIADAPIPVSLYDPYGYEAGAAFLLPDARVFFLGSTGHTAYYTPSGSTANGTWTAGPDIPDGQGTPDAAAAMMVNGKILCAVSPIPTSDNHFPSPTSFYEFDYLTNSFTQVGAPGGGTTNNNPSFPTMMLDLPDGTVLFANQSSTQFYVYTPNGVPLASGKPVINDVTLTSCATYRITGTGFNGISEGAAYGDDAQMATNYPIVRLTSGSNVYYCRTTNWNSTGVMRGNAPDTVTMTLPLNAPDGAYTMVLTANGIASDPVNITIATNCLCSPPSNLQVTNITAKSATISWDTVRRATKYILSYKESDSSVWIVKHLTGDTFNLKGLSINTSYDIQIQTKCPNRKSTFSSISFRTLPYCTITSSTYLEYIDKVALGSINNQSGNNNGYADFTALSTDLRRGSSVKISLTPGFTPPDTWDEFWEVYIDYNQNGVFTDKGELINAGDSTGTITKRFRVKSTAKLGPTRMRIIMNYGEPLGTPCSDIGGGGEAEDYTVNIVDSTVAANASEATAEIPGISSLLIMPNPVNTSSATAVLNLAKQGNVSVKIIDIAGRILYQQQFTNAHAGKNAVALRGLNIPNGVFIVQAEQEGILIGRTKIVVNR